MEIGWATAYGAILTTWGSAGIVGPQLVAWLRDNYSDNASTYAFYVGAAFLLAGFLVSLGLRNSVKKDRGLPKVARLFA